jgi:hypothetical protein
MRILLVEDQPDIASMYRRRGGEAAAAFERAGALAASVVSFRLAAVQ